LCIAVRAHVPSWLSHLSSPPRQRPSPAAPQPPLRGLVQRQYRAASLPSATQAGVTVSASLRHPPKNLQAAHRQALRERRSQAPSLRPSFHAPPVSSTALLPACISAATCSRCPSHPTSLARTRMRLVARASETAWCTAVPLAWCSAWRSRRIHSHCQTVCDPAPPETLHVCLSSSWRITYPSASLRVVYAPSTP
jgi:hypothetical protein